MLAGALIDPIPFDQFLSGLARRDRISCFLDLDLLRDVLRQGLRLFLRQPNCLLLCWRPGVRLTLCRGLYRVIASLPPIAGPRAGGVLARSELDSSQAIDQLRDVLLRSSFPKAAKEGAPRFPPKRGAVPIDSPSS